ncbi:hypothetical protein [Janthinobacterium sp. HH104]|uniref:hypothetical protein n=1 Tax=Janthinobacterium sp. HH104 TaxID=1537276 RepID=UPI0011131479|nr:hypothetical protein [Janthinobacterium sp. HH104]
MKIHDLPRHPFPKKIINRSIYNVFWWPFGAIIELINGFMRSLLFFASWTGIIILLIIGPVVFKIFG